jgi:hypothetical protein
MRDELLKIADTQQEILNLLKEMAGERVGGSDPLLKSNEIRKALNIGTETFRKRRSELIRYGLSKNGGRWMMRESAFKKYLKGKGIS